MKKTYYFFNLEIALKKEDDSNVYAYENVSHIPTLKLIEIFEIDLKLDPYLLEGYFLTEENPFSVACEAFSIITSYAYASGYASALQKPSCIY